MSITFSFVIYNHFFQWYKFTKNLNKNIPLEIINTNDYENRA